MTPEGWRDVTVADVAEVNPEQLGGDTPATFELLYLDIASVERTGQLGVPVAYQFANAPSRARRRARSGDILVSTVRPYLRSFARIRDAAPNLVASTGFAVIRPLEAVDSDFLYQHVLADDFIEFLKPRMKGGNYPAVTGADVSSYPVLLPPLLERRKIAAILSSVDEAIEGTQTVIDQLQVVKKAMMADLLTRGIPGRHKKFKQTEIGEVPEEWDIRPFADICLAIVDGVHKKPDYVREGIPFVTIKNLTAVEEGISFEDLNYISPEDHAQFTKRTRPERGDILLTKDGTLGIPRVVDTDRAFSIFVSVAVMKPIRSLIDSWFMRFALEAPAIAAHFGVVNAGMALKHIHLVDLRATPCPVPPLAEQREISEAIRSVCSRIVAEKEHLAAVSATKSALMSVLLTGEVRVRVDEEEAA